MRDIIRLMRPMQWTKNAFVFTGVIFSEAIDEPNLMLRVIVTAIAFCFASSSVYVVNDIVDRKRDRAHPTKKNRPIASGKVPIPTAIQLAIILAMISFGFAVSVSYTVLEIIFCYIALNIAYSYRLKNVVILDVFCISAGFMLRILAGTIGVAIPPSNWLLLCGLMITLFLGFAKRRAEIIALEHKKEEHREVLDNYGPELLDQAISICATGVIIGYSLYTMSPDTIRIHHTENLIFTVPFVIYALFRYIYLLHHCKRAGDPTSDLLTDKHIIGSVIGWAIYTGYLFS